MSLENCLKRILVDEVKNFGVFCNDSHYMSSTFSRNENSFDIEIAIPGLEKEDLELSIENNDLYLEITNKNPFVEKGKYKLYKIYKNLDIKKTKAEYINGILKVKIPFKEPKKQIINIK